MYIPKKGDIVWINFNPQSGREQAVRRPALVVSLSRYNRLVGLALVCPITTKFKGFMFEITIPEELKTSVVVLADRVKSFHYKTRRAEFPCQMPEEILMQVIIAINRMTREV
ncbi:MAG: type II toxin-antitoxin system PemK/MazF family toxin [Cyanobacteriota bacterium]|nr:type II toxin-antitoxin system PemK/MazF family toxin [Cyanobacteriota bacterium]